MGRSGVFWLGTSNREIAGARHALTSMTQAGVIDELGFLVLQAAFADRLYPGVNTIMTRARYLVFLPAIYRHLERPGVLRGRDPERVARDLQWGLCQALMKTEKRGVIGSEGGRDIARLPSNVYWYALHDLGIAVQGTSEESYFEWLASGGTENRTVKDDDAAAHLHQGGSLWDPRLRDERFFDGTTFVAGTSFSLTVAEARDLRRRYATLSRGGGESLLTRMVTWGTERGERLPDLPNPWDVPQLAPPLRGIVDHARLLSLFARGTVLQYMKLLMEKRGDDDASLLGVFEEWHARAEDLRSWSLPDFFRLATDLGGLRLGDPRFIEAWLQCLRDARTARELFESAEARRTIVERERAARGIKARLRSAYHLKTWNPPTRVPSNAYYHLSYRHPTALVFARDIVDALVGARAP